ncbi:MAG: PepSY-associated TM helix domain-containing protein [Pyrinomonadaceae bacterium]
MQIFRKSIFWLHLILGAVGGVVIFIMCVTGAALSFEKDILANLEYSQRHVQEGEARLLPSAILAKVLEKKPESRPGTYTFQNDRTAAVTVALGREGSVFVDPYTGNITGEGNKSARAFFGTMTDLHRWLMMSGDGRPVGKAITGAYNLMFLGLAITGIYVWFPRKLTWQHVRPRFWFRSGVTGKPRDFNWHTTIGFWSSLVLVVLTVTAAVISYQWAGNLIYTLTGDDVPKQNPPAPASQTPPPPFVVPENIDALWAKATSHTVAQGPTWKSISVRMPIAKEATFTIDEAKDWNIFGRATLTLDAASTAVVKWEPYADKIAASLVRSWMRFTHTGESFGLIGQFIGFVACIGGAVLVYSGFALAFRRLAKFVRKRRNARQQINAESTLQTLGV